MVCKKCGSEWKTDQCVSTLLLACPFCGVSLADEVVPAFFDKSKDALCFIATRYGIEILLGVKVSNYFPDIAPGLKEEKEIVKALQVSGALTVLKNHLHSSANDQEIAIMQATGKLPSYIDKAAVEGMLREFAVALGWQLSAPGVNSLMRRAQLSLENGDFKSATEYANKVLDIDTEYAPAYIAKLQASLGIRKEEDLGRLDASLEKYADYLKALRFADSMLKAVYIGYNQRILDRIDRVHRAEQDRIENERKEGVYRSAMQLKQKGTDLDFRCAGWEFQKIPGYKDANAQAHECAQLAVQQKARLEQERLEQERQTERDRLEAQRLESLRIRKFNRMLAFLIPGVLLIAVIIIIITQVITPRNKYQSAKNLLLSGRYDQAIAAFISLGNYADSQSIVQQAQADSIFAGGDFAGAYKIYAALDKKYWTHEAEYAQLYRRAEQLLAQGAYYEAAIAFGNLGSYNDATIRIKQTQADKLFAARDFENAYTIYATLDQGYRTHGADYEAMYKEAQRFLAERKFDEAVAAFLLIPNYSDASMQSKESLYQKGKALMAEGKFDEAILTFRDLSDYADSQSQLKKAQADDLFATKDYMNAYSIYTTLDEAYRTHEADYRVMYTAGETAQASGDLDAAIAAYAAIENYLDSADKLTQVRYLKAQVLVDAGQLMDAEAVYVQIPTYNDVQARLVALHLRIANAAIEAKEYSRALEYYLKLPQTDDLKSREYKLAQTCFDEGAFALATQTYELLGQYELSLSKLQVARYAYASQLYNQENFAISAKQFSMLGNMKDSAARSKAASYQHGLQLMAQGVYDEAKVVFNTILDYQDASAQVQEAEYLKAVGYMTANDFASAADLFGKLSKYKDSRTQAQACEYELAQIALSDGSYADAQRRFTALGNYSDSAEKVTLCVYKQAEDLHKAGDYAVAEKLYSSISGYSDSIEEVKYCRLQQGKALYATGEWTGALTFLQGLNYEDSETLTAGCHFALGEAALMSGKQDTAVREYAQAVVLPEAQEKLYGIGKGHAVASRFEKAIQTLWAASGYAPAQALLQELGSLLDQSGRPEMAMIAYCSLGKTERGTVNLEHLTTDITLKNLQMVLRKFYLLPNEIGYTDECVYQYATVLLEYKYYDKAAEAFGIIKGYKDAETMISESSYQKGKALADAGSYLEAYLVLKKLKDYKDTAYLISSKLELSDIAIADEIDQMFTEGNTVTFGAFEQDNNFSNGQEAIMWRVIAREETEALLVSVYSLDSRPYHSQHISITWETSDLRSWLNGVFLNTAFTQTQQNAIVTSTLVNDNNSKYAWTGSEPTQDKVFLLSEAETKRYLTNVLLRYAKNTSYTEAQGAESNNIGAGWWWLRTLGFDRRYASFINAEGEFGLYGRNVNRNDGAVRPALYVDLEQFYKLEGSNGSQVSADTISEKKTNEGSSAQTTDTKKPRMGITITTLNPSSPLVLDGSLPHGAYITKVEAGTSADAAGLKVGDIIVNISGTDIKDANGLVMKLYSFKSGDKVKIKFFRAEGLVDVLNGDKSASTLGEGVYQTISIEL